MMDNLNHILNINIINESVDWIGKHGPIFLIFMGIFHFINQLHKLIIFLFGVGVNVILNMWIKPIIRQKRPEPIDVSIDNPQYWGMPSGHAQYVGYILTFLYFSKLPASYFTALYCIGIIVLWQRWYSKAHSILQILAGTLLGIALGAFFVKLHF